MMSATPIPRTLAMSYYADLDVSVLDELPPGRTPIKTRLVADNRRDDVVRLCRQARGCADGRQAYWVCPLIEESESCNCRPRRIPLTRFQSNCRRCASASCMAASRRRKAAVMAAFAAGEIDVLVATTVIEVGVDVPNASLMVIEHAERFGLSQLHQLRGRVGRGAHESVCVLLYAAAPCRRPMARAAEDHLREHRWFRDRAPGSALRGPGEFVGSRQSGCAAAALRRSGRAGRAARWWILSPTCCRAGALSRYPRAVFHDCCPGCQKDCADGDHPTAQDGKPLSGQAADRQAFAQGVGR
jgi:ATP-dependent DNA helicase RecG